MQKRATSAFLTVPFLVILVMFALPANAAHMASPHYRIPTSVLSGSGVPMTSGSYQTNEILGQSTPLMVSSDPPYSASYDLYPGFWYTLEALGFPFGAGAMPCLILLLSGE